MFLFFKLVDFSLLFVRLFVLYLHKMQHKERYPSLSGQIDIFVHISYLYT